jgi:hypothetical protein
MDRFTSSSSIRGKSVSDSVLSFNYYNEDLDSAITLPEYQVSYSQWYDDAYADENESYDSSVDRFNGEVSTPDYKDSFATCLQFKGSIAQCLQFVKDSLKRAYGDGDESYEDSDFGVDYYNKDFDGYVTITEDPASSVVTEEGMDSTSQDHK